MMKGEVVDIRHQHTKVLTRAASSLIRASEEVPKEILPPKAPAPVQVKRLGQKSAKKM
jgi:hypothetical protein